MAKKNTDSDSPATTDRSENTTAEPIGETVDILMKSETTHGTGKLARGQKIGSVQLESGISLNYLVDAIRSGLAAEQNVVKELMGEK